MTTAETNPLLGSSSSRPDIFSLVERITLADVLSLHHRHRFLLVHVLRRGGLFEFNTDASDLFVGNELSFGGRTNIAVNGRRLVE